MLSFLSQYAYNIHSQNGEDGILAECLGRLGMIGGHDSDGTVAHEAALHTGHCVEVGANDGQWLSNTRHLIEQGWTGVMVEADYDLYKRCAQNWSFTNQVRVQCSRVDGRNINAFVDERCDVLSLDTDGSDYEIFKGLKAQPKIVILEIDSSIPPNVPGFNSDGGASYFTGVELGLEKGYFLLCHTGNLIFIDEQYKHLFPEVKSKHPLIDSDHYFNRAWLKDAAA